MRKRDRISIRCDNCGASLKHQPSEELYTCEYCGHQFVLRTREQRKPPAPETPAADTAGSSSPPAIPSLLFGLLVLAGIGAAVYYGARPALRWARQALSGGSSDTRFTWTDPPPPPELVRLGDGEVVVGRIRAGGQDDQLSIAAVDGATARVRWRGPALGTYGDAYQWTPFAVAGGRVVFPDLRGTLHVHDVATGKPVREHRNPDRIRVLCSAPDTTQVWVVRNDGKAFLVDLASGETAPGAGPVHCRKGALRYRREGHLEIPHPEVEGLEARRVHVDGDIGVVYGVKGPGTPVPMAVGFDPATREVRWERPLITVDPLSVRVDAKDWDALAAGRYLATYREGSDTWHLCAHDARTGDRLWDVALPGSDWWMDRIHALLASESRVYLLRRDTLEVRRADDGKLVGIVGRLR